MAVTSSPRLGLTRWSAGDDPFTRAHMETSHGNLDSLTAIYLQGATGDRPAAGVEGRYFWDETTKLLSYDDGTSWRDVITGTGNSTIQPITNDRIGLTIKGHLTQSADMLQIQTSTGTVIAKIDKDGNYSGKSVTFTSFGAYSDVTIRRQGGTVSVPAVMASGDNLGRIVWSGYTVAGATYTPSAIIEAVLDATPESAGDTTDMPSRLSFYTTADGSGTATERLRIDNGGTSTFYGTVTAGSGAGAAGLNISGGSGSYRSLRWQTNGVGRWVLFASNVAESGSNVGSDLTLWRYGDDGTTLLGTSLQITRSTGAIAITAPNFTVSANSTYIGDGTGGATLYINAAAANNRIIRFQTAGSTRWAVYTETTAETGSNAGSNFAISRYDDSGVNIGNSLIITRSTGAIALTAPNFTISGNLVTAGDGTGAVYLYMNGGAGNNRGLRIRTNGSDRWLLFADNTAESGSNAGTNFYLNRYDDNATLLGSSVVINRATGSIALNGSVQAPTVGTRSALEIMKTATWWIDAAAGMDGQYVRNLGTGGSALDAVSGSSAYAADSNDPMFLDWQGTNYIYSPGASNNFLSVPDEAALDITGDIDIRVQVALDSWTPAAINTLLAKFNTAGAYSYRLFVNQTNGYLYLDWSTDGTVYVTSTSTVAVSAAAGAVKWVRATLDVDNGAAGNTTTFYTSDDGVTWTQLGNTVVKAGTTSIFSGASNLYICDKGSATGQNLAGKVYRAQVYNGINGTLALDVDTSVITSSAQTTFLAKTGQTVTVNRSTSGRKTALVTTPVWLFGTDDYMSVSDNDLLDFGATDSFTVLAVVRQWATVVASGAILTKTDGTLASNTGYLIASETAGYRISFQDGTNRTRSDIASGNTASVQVVGLVRDVSGDALRSYLNGSLSSSTTDVTTGSLGNALGLRVGRYDAASGVYADMEGIAFAVFRRALTQYEIDAITGWYTYRSGIPSIPVDQSAISRSFIMQSPSGTKFRVSVADDGSLVTTAV